MGANPAQEHGSTGDLKAMDFARRCIEGPGGMNDYEEHEIVIWHVPDRVAAAHWMLECLANPECAGSDVAVAAILARRRAAAGAADPEAAGAIERGQSWREAFVKALRQDGVTQGALDRATRLAGRAAGGEG